MLRTSISIKGAREHNLKNIDVDIPRDQFVVITGVSGSGKSSLAFDTIYAEGQRRYVESLSAYARQFLGQMEKPDVDYIEGLSPAISIDQKSTSRNPRSTVGTVTEIYDYFRLLFARVGTPHCPKCGRLIAQQTVEQIVDAIQDLPEGSRIMIMAPMVKDRKGEHQAIFEEARKSGYVRVRVDGQTRDLSEEFSLDKNKKHSVDVIVDRMMVKRSIGTIDSGQNQNEETENSESDTNRIADSVETALKLGAGVVLIGIVGGEELLFSEHFACVHCGVSFGEIAPRTFSFNSPHGACPACTGLGTKLEVDPDLIISNQDLTIAEGAISPWARASTSNTWLANLLASVAHRYSIPLREPVRKLSDQQLNIILYGSKGDVIKVKHENKYGRSREYDTTFEGVIPNLERRYKETDSDYIRSEIERYMSTRPCPVCQGKRLKPQALAVTIGDLNIMQVTAMSISELHRWIEEISREEADGLSQRQLAIANQILKEIRSRLGFLIDVGLDYLSLDRAAASLSGGEAQRIRLATQIGSGLMGVLYICDEPSIGLHPADDERLIRTLKKLRDLGNTLLIVEHDESMMRAADFIIDMGPGAGEHGGRVVATGTLEEIKANPASLTGDYLSGRRQIKTPETRRNGSGKELIVKGAQENNLKNLDVRIPLGKLVCVTGVSGSGKSSLIDEILHKHLSQVFYKAKDRPGKFDAILGVEHLDKIVNIDQSPIGRTPRSNPATYTGLFTPIRELFTTVPEARMRGYAPGRFSFNVKGGRCEACKGEGYVEIEMHFLPNITIPCEICKGKRYNREALEIRFKGKNIAEVLDMTVEEGLAYFDSFSNIKSKLQTLADVGLGYMRLGQPSTTLSGGEAQRVKLATELSRRATGRTIYILDEPTTGLSFEDVAALLRVLQRLVDSGNSVVLIEHHLDLIKSADYLIDLGPCGGNKGGYLIAAGTPEEVAQVNDSQTGRFLRSILHVEPEMAESSR